MAIFGLLDNNILFFISGLIALGYNIYSRIKKVHTFNMIIDGVKIKREFIKNFTLLDNAIPEPAPITFDEK